MDQRRGKSNKVERSKMRKKLLENEGLLELSKEGLLELSKEGHIHSENQVKSILDVKSFEQLAWGEEEKEMWAMYDKDENLMKETMVKKKDKLSGKKRKEQNVTGAAADKVDHPGSHGKDSSKRIKYEKSVEGKEEKKTKKLSKKKRNKQNVSGATVSEIDEFDSEGKKTKKLSKKKRNKQNVSGTTVSEIDEFDSEGEDGFKKLKDDSLASKKSARLQEADVAVNKKTKKSKRVGRKKDQIPSEKDNKLIKEENGSVASEVYHISAVDIDSSKGMKKWISEYHQNRPGLEILQQRIDEFIISREEQEEQTRKEKEARAAEGGWTVVVHQKGRKKTTEAESGTTMGSVAQAAVVEKMMNAKKKDVGPDFYRFQKREAQRNEIMMLQSKFEQDKKRIQQLRAARKFRPY